jgi:hypothetical protein
MITSPLVKARIVPPEVGQTDLIRERSAACSATDG